MDLLTRFTDFLNSPPNKLSSTTVKNYKADIASFISWYKKQYNQDLGIGPTNVTSQIVELYKRTKIQESNLSGKSVKRHLSSLRKFFQFLKEENILSSDPSPKINNPNILTKIKWKIKGRPLFYPLLSTSRRIPWYKIAIIILFVSQIGLIVYQNFKDQLLRTYMNNLVKSAVDKNSDKILGSSSSKEKSLDDLDFGLKIIDASGNTELLSDLKVGGDIISSGSATFNKINLNLAENVASLSSKELIATGSAGSAWISSSETEVVVNNAIITDHSLIYITPIGTPSGQTPFLLRQVLETSFTVGIASPSATYTFFNWLIIN